MAVAVIFRCHDLENQDCSCTFAPLVPESKLINIIDLFMPDLASLKPDNRMASSCPRQVVQRCTMHSMVWDACCC